jgi:hypothetical protein
MDYQPRTVALVVELLHPPVGNDPRPVQKLHNEMFSGGHPAYAGFQVTQVGPVLSNPMALPGAVSQVAFLPDRVQFREERSSLTHEAFAERVRAVAGRSAELRQVPLFVAQTVVIHSLVNPRSSADTRLFLRDRMLGIGDALGLLGHPTDLIGLRVGLRPAAPPATNGGTAAEDSASFALRIESWQQDPRSLFIELAGNFGPIAYLLGGAPQEFPPAPTGAAALEENILATYRYLERNVLPFIARFDRRGEERRTDE